MKLTYGPTPSFHPGSHKFIEDHKRYKAERLSIWNNKTILIKQLVADSNGGALEDFIQPQIYQQYSIDELKAIQLKNKTQALIEVRNKVSKV